MAEVIDVPVEAVVPNPFQPRETFPKEGLEQLADSLSGLEMIEPVVVRPKGQAFQLACGERRWRAAQLAGWETIPAIVRDLDDKQLQLYSLVENWHRENLTSREREKAIFDIWSRYYNRKGGKTALARDLSLSVDSVAQAIYAKEHRAKLPLKEEQLESITTKDILETRGLDEKVAGKALRAKATGELEATELQDIAPILRRSDPNVADEFLEDYLSEKRAVRAEVDRARRVVEGQVEPSKELRRQLTADEKRLKDVAELSAKIRSWTVASVELIETAELRRKAAQYIDDIARYTTALARDLGERDWK